MKVKTLTIVGGGTSAWLAAAYLFKNHPDIKITVVDKEVGNPIGVGEATLLTFRPFMEECGFSIEDWMVDLDAGYKSGIVFSNWRHEGDNIWHPFYKGNRLVDNTFHIHDLWSNVQELDYKKYALSQWDSSITHNSVDANNIESYANHVDCGKLVVYIQERLKNKINIIRSEVVEVVKTGDLVSQLTLADGQIIKSDLYIDCTGFKQLLGASKQRVDLEDRLFVNTAVAGPIPYQDRATEFKPYADCEAVDHGWIWKIGVGSRIGSGMVFNRDITSPEEAKEYFVKHWDNRTTVDKLRVIDWTPFYNKDQFVGNVVNIGLSAGFIEPLESTGIGLITVGITQVSNALQENYILDQDVVNFNTFMTTLFEDCVDFVSAHYANNTRKSKFWDHVRSTFKPSVRMLHQIEQLNDPTVKIPTGSRFNYMFGGSNWSLLLIQLGYPVAERPLSVPKEVISDMLISNYIENEKYRHVWSRHHASEIDRATELCRLKS
jgi:tryptophan halogenase